jgi:hypothetical protein
MTDFDTRLRERLERLDAAIPAPRLPSVPTPAGRPAAVTGRRSGAPRRRRGLIVLLAAAIMLAGSVAIAQRITYPDLPEPALEGALTEILAGRCLSATAATPAIQGKLDALGKTDWVIESRPGAADASCVSSFIVVPHHAVVLVPGISRNVAQAMEFVADELLRQCLGRADAIQLVSSALTSAGADRFVVRADPWGNQGGPLKGTYTIDDYRRHVAQGCFVFVGMPTRTADGAAILELWGRWP